MDDAESKHVFEQEIFRIKHRKSQNCVLMTRNEYNGKLQRLLELENPQVARTPGDYKLLKTYDYVIQNEGDRQTRRLVKRGTSYYCVPIEELYNILKSAHIQLRHAGRNAMQLFFRDKYCNITKDCIMAYLYLCKQCPRKKKIREHRHKNPDDQQHLEGIDMLQDDDDEIDEAEVSQFENQHGRETDHGMTSGSAHGTDNFSRGQVDMIDMRTRRDNEYCHILRYTNLQTNEVRLKPMQFGTAIEAANLLVDIYCEQGAPIVLQSLNGRDFVQEIVSEVVKIWPNCRQLHGNLRVGSNMDVQNDFQQLVDQLNNLQNRLKTKVWAQLLRFLQWEINSVYNAETGRSILEGIYGKQPGLGLPPSKLLEAVYDKAQSEEQIMDYIADAELLRLSAFCSSACQPHPMAPRTFPQNPCTSATASVSVSTGHFIDESQLMPAKPVQNSNPPYHLQSTASSSSVVTSESPIYMDYQSLQMTVEAERAAQQQVPQPSPPTTQELKQNQPVFIQPSQPVPQPQDIGPGPQIPVQQPTYITEIIQMKNEGENVNIPMSNGQMEHFAL
ncbi:hypothetical protein FO519_003050 [Halicephalobus sp. NKZ332]|nr:hypothetical protein FO519_003050 [Halicephalobus sp. NKZ332]